MVERGFLAISTFLLILSLQLIALLGFEVFTPGWALCAGVCALVISWRVVSREPRPRSRFVDWAALLILLGALALRANPASILYGGQDPGVYENTGAYFANRGTSVIRDEMIPALADRPDLREYYIREGYRVKRRPDGSYHGLLLPGFYAVDAEQGIFVPQFYHLHPAWLGVGSWLWGPAHQGWVISVFSALTVLGA